MRLDLVASNAEGSRAGARAGASKPVAAFILALRSILGYARNIGERPARDRQLRDDREASTGGASGDGGFFVDVNRLMQVSASYEDAFAMVRRRAAAAFADCSGALYLMRKPGDNLEMKMSWGEEVGCGDCFATAECRVMRSGVTQFAAADMACAQRRQSLRGASLCLPIEAQGTVLGVLMLQEGASAGSLDSLRPVAEYFADNVGLALANMKLRDTLRRMSGRDPLAQLNRSGAQTAVREDEHGFPAVAGARKTA